MKSIKVIGAKGHNLKNITVSLPKGKMTVVTGLSGSGKSSLAFDTIYAEGQRRYVERMSAYARQFLELMEKPDVEHIEGLSPAISIEQRNPSKNPRSTVATVTEIYDYLRLLFARVGHRHCPQCGREVETWSVQGIAQDILKKITALLFGFKCKYRIKECSELSAVKLIYHNTEIPFRDFLRTIFCRFYILSH